MIPFALSVSYSGTSAFESAWPTSETSSYVHILGYCIARFTCNPGKVVDCIAAYYHFNLDSCISCSFLRICVTHKENVVLLAYIVNTFMLTCVNYCLRKQSDVLH